MKKLFLSALIGFIFIQNGFSQINEDAIRNLENWDKQPIYWGYYLGFNQYDFKFDYKENNLGNSTDILVGKSTGFNVGLIGNLRLNSFLDLRFEPGLYYNVRNLFFPDPSLIEDRDRTREVSSTYIHFPLLLKVSTKRIANFKPYLVGGFSTSLNLGSNEKSPDDNFNGTFRMKTNTYYYELGIGIDFYLYYFKFSPSIRGVFAMSDELQPDENPNSPWTGNINGMRSRGVFINFTFE